MAPDNQAKEIVTDIDGNSYETIGIGDQVWLASNLRVTHFNNGDEIPSDYTNVEWAELFTSACCSYDQIGDEIISLGIAQFHQDNAATWREHAPLYGLLYNWFAVDDYRGIAPNGWHIPTDKEWKTLEVQLGMPEKDTHIEGYAKARGGNEGSKLSGRKELWLNDYDLRHNPLFGNSGFNALPSGQRFCNQPGNFHDLGRDCSFWTKSEYLGDSDVNAAWIRALSGWSSNIFRCNLGYKTYGLSVRCLKDKILP